MNSPIYYSASESFTPPSVVVADQLPWPHHPVQMPGRRGPSVRKRVLKYLSGLLGLIFGIGIVLGTAWICRKKTYSASDPNVALGGVLSLGNMVYAAPLLSLDLNGSFTMSEPSDMLLSWMKFTEVQVGLKVNAGFSDQMLAAGMIKVPDDSKMGQRKFPLMIHLNEVKLDTDSRAISNIEADLESSCHCLKVWAIVEANVHWRSAILAKSGSYSIYVQCPATVSQNYGAEITGICEVYRDPARLV